MQYENERVPVVGYSNKRWQVDFAKMKESRLNEDAPSSVFPGSAKFPEDSSQFRYLEWINDILENIRSGGTDYCFYIFQVWDLIRMMEKDEVPGFRTKWSPTGGYFSLSF